MSTLMHPFDEGQGRKVVMGHAGPKSYTRFSGGGDTIHASEFALKNLYHVAPGMTTDGLYYVWPANNGLQNAQGKSVAALWIVVATNAEVGAAVDLSGSIVSLRAVGN